MNRLLAFFVLMLLLIGSGCTQNNGHIGPVFGSWALVEISADGTPLELIDETVFRFQNEVVQVDHIFSEFDRILRIGNFTISDNVMTMKFLTELTSDYKGSLFLMPTWLYFPKGEMPLRFDILTLKGNRMQLALDNGGKKYVYKFERTW